METSKYCRDKIKREKRKEVLNSKKTAGDVVSSRFSINYQLIPESS
jgi:hypothetical protein